MATTVSGMLLCSGRSLQLAIGLILWLSYLQGKLLLVKFDTALIIMGT